MAKILYFLAGPVATEPELAEIAALNTQAAAPYEVAVRNGTLSTAYGAGIETADFVAGTIPVAYDDAEDFPVFDIDAPPAPPVGDTQIVITSGVAETGVTLVGTAGAGKSMVLTIAAGAVTTATFT